MKKLRYTLLLSFLMNAGLYAQDWHVAGNAGTTPGTHFIGTTDTKALMFKVNNLRSGYIDYAANKANTSFGFQALKNPTGANNVAIGYKSAFSNTSGYSNVAIGGGALYKNAAKSNLVAIGDSALYNNGSNAPISYYASCNTAIGSKALYTNTTGFYNTATGFESLFNNLDGSYNNAFGFRALYNNISGFSNTAIGREAMYDNIDGYRNTAVGEHAGQSSTSDSYSTFIGYYAGQTGSTDLINSTAIGYNSSVSASHQIRIGNASITSLGGFEPWTDLSDGRFKSEIKENVKGLEFIKKLKPVTYHLKVHELNAFLHPNKQLDTEDIQHQALLDKAMDNKEKVLYTGFVAQEVEKAAKELNYDFNGVDAPDNEHDHYGLRYSLFVVPLVKAVQELSEENDALKKQHEVQQKINKNLENRLAKLEALMNTKASSNQKQESVTLSTAVLSQNTPNPARSMSSISYSLPDKYQSAKILITDYAGKVIKEVALYGNANGKITFNTGSLASGAYQYTLIIDNEKVDAKTLMVSK